MRLAAAVAAMALVLLACSDANGDVVSSSSDAVVTSVSAESSSVPPPAGNGTTVDPPTSTLVTPETTTTTTTESPQAPSLQVTDPVPEQIITTRSYTFRGTTDQGAAVAVGDSYADVDPAGEWALDLLLPPGSSATTFVATDPTTALSTSVRLQLRYEPNASLEIAEFADVGCGTAHEAAMESLTGLLGPPSRLEADGREAEWQWSQGGLIARFAEWSLCTMGDEVQHLHFVGWEIQGDSAGLRFRGIAPGSMVAELMAVVEQDSCEDGTGGEGCVQLSEEPHDGGYWFFLSDGLMPPPVFGYANGPEPATAVILRLATEAPT